MGGTRATGRSQVEHFQGLSSLSASRFWSLALAGSVLLASSTAFAAEPTAEDKAGARAAATAGADAFEQGKWSESLDYFRRAESIIHSPVHELYMARAHVQLGQFVQARELFLEIRRENKDSATGGKFADSASADLSALEPRIPQITVQLDGAEGKDPEITVDGRPFRAVLVGVPQPIDPGKHTFVVRAGNQEGRSEITLAEGEKQTVRLELTATSQPTPVTPITPAPGAETPAVDSTSTSTSPEGEPNWMRIGSYGAFGVGAAGLAVGIIFGLTAQDKAKQADQLCVDETRSPGCQGASNSVQDRVEALDREYDDAATLSTIGFIAGGVGVAAGVTLFLLSGEEEKPPADSAKIRVQPVLGATYWGVRGTF